MIQRSAKPGISRTFLLGFVLFFAASPAFSAKTLMVLVDWWLPQPMDTVIDLKVQQPGSEIKYLPSPTLAPPSPVKTNAYETDPLSTYSWWYSLPNFSPDDYAMGRVRFNNYYMRGWYQNDSTYIMPADTALKLADTTTVFTYRDPVTQRDVIVSFPAGAPRVVNLPKGASFRGPKLYTSQGNGGTEVLNMRPNLTGGGVGMGALDKCMDSLPGDTLWVRFIAAGQTAAVQQPTAASMKCTNYNPFSTLRLRVYLRNPWPGSDPVVEWNGVQVPMYQANQSDWMYAELRYIDTLASKPPISIRFRKGTSGTEYFDSSGVATGMVQPFVINAPKDNGNYYFVPPEAGGDMVIGAGQPPTSAPYTMYVQNPWKPGTPRGIWEGNSVPRVFRPTDNCGWYKYPLYSAPKKMLIGHSFEDSVYGSIGVQFRTRTNWVTIAATDIKADGSIWIQTQDATGARIGAKPSTSVVPKNCMTDSLKLVMEVFDYKGLLNSAGTKIANIAGGKITGSGTATGGGNPAFQVAGPKGETSAGLAKGLVKPDLDPITKLPVWSGRDTGLYNRAGLNNPNNPGLSTPTNWFDTTALQKLGIDVGHTCIELPLKKQGVQDSGYFQFRSDAFFPVDTISDKRGWSPFASSLIAPNDGKDHNFLFCMHGHAAFEYTPGLKFQFKGDDDVWVYINNKLAVDLGGQHAPESAYVNLDRLKLQEGKVYPFDIFYCERQTNESHIWIRTTMDLQPSWQYKDSVVKNADGSMSFHILGLKTQNFTPTCADLTSGNKPKWQSAAGRMVVIGPSGSSMYTAYNTDTSLYGGNLKFLNNNVTLDTNKLAVRPELMWPGVYTIRIESVVGDPLDSISFTKTYGAVNVDGTVLDPNGDGIADSVYLKAPRAILATADNPSYHVVWFTAAGKKDSIIATAGMIRKISDSAVMIDLSSKTWGVRTQLPGVKPDSLGAILTHPNGLIDAVINPIRLLDGIAPIADSAWIVYDTTGSGKDSLFVRASEPVKAALTAAPAGLGGWVLLGNSGPSGARVDTTKGSLVGTNVFAIAYAPTSNPVRQNDSLRLGALVADLVGNAPGKLSKWIPIHSTPVASSWMMDVNGDGAPDSIAISSKGDLSGADSVRAQWKTASGADTVISVRTPGGLGTGLRLPAGILKNATFCQVCRLTVYVGSDVRGFKLSDSVPAAAVSARFGYGIASDTLIIVASEPVTLGNKPGEGWSAMKSAPSVDPLGTLVAGTGFAYKDTIRLTVPQGSFTADSVRLRGWAKDAFGRIPGAVSPWVKVVYGVQPIRAVLFDKDGDGAADSVAFRLTRSASGAPVPSSFSVQWGSETKSVASLSPSADGMSWAGPIGPFARGVTSTGNSSLAWIRVGSDSVTWKAPIEDSVPAIATKAQYRFGSLMDTLVVDVSEPVVQGNAVGQGWFGIKPAGSADVAGTVVATTGAIPGLVVRLPIAPGIVTGDSLRLRGWALGKGDVPPGVVSPFVPLIYGPQPIRVIVRDLNGDGMADDVEYRLKRSAVGAPVPTGFGLTWNSQPLSATTLSRSTDLLSWRGAIGPAALGTTSLPTDVGWIAVGLDVDSYRAVVEDSVAPVAKSAKLIFGFEQGSADTLVIVGSEKLFTSGAALAFVSKDSAGVPTPVMSASPSLDDTVLRIAVPAGSIASDAAWARFGKSITDGQKAVGDSSRWVKLKITPSGRGYLYDSNGDGQADSLFVQLRGTLVADQIRVTWSDATGSAGDVQVWNIPVSQTTDFGVHAPGLGFPKGNTACVSGCTVQFLDKNSDVATWTLIDRVAPMIRSGRYTFGNGTDPDTLSVVFSEAVKSISANPSWVEWAGKGVTGSVSHSPIPSISVDGLVGTLLLQGANVASDSWDSVRIASGALAGNLSDIGGTVAGKTSPLAPLTWGIPPMTAAVYDPNGKGQGTEIGVWLNRPVPTAAFQGVDKLTVTWGGETKDVALPASATGMWRQSLSTPFALGNTSCDGCTGGISAGAASRAVVVLDSVPPSAIKAVFRYSTRVIARDTLTLWLSEPWTGAVPGNFITPLAMIGKPASGVELDSLPGWFLKPDNSIVFLLDTFWQDVMNRGDSARLSWNGGAPLVRDMVGNRVGEKSRWVPIEFGMRPVEFIIEQVGALTRNGRGKADSWTEPPVGTPGIEIMVRPLGKKNDKDYVLIGDGLQIGPDGQVTGGLPPKNPIERTMRVHIKLNRPLDGMLFVYDNMGTSVRQIDLSVLKDLWPAGSEDIEREVQIGWNGTGENGKFVASGVYLMRAVVKYKDKEGKSDFRNLLWKYGWIYDKK